MSNQNCPIETYYQAWESGNLDQMERVLSDDFVFHGPMERHEGPASFMRSLRAMASNPMFKTWKMGKPSQIAQGDEVAAFYDIKTPQGDLPMAERFRVRNGKIARIDCYFDASVLRAQG